MRCGRVDPCGLDIRTARRGRDVLRRSLFMGLKQSTCHELLPRHAENPCIRSAQYRPTQCALLSSYHSASFCGRLFSTHNDRQIHSIIDLVRRGVRQSTQGLRQDALNRIGTLQNCAQRTDWCICVMIGASPDVRPFAGSRTSRLGGSNDCIHAQFMCWRTAA